MSITGRGDAIGEISKDDEPEISSTTRDSGDIAQNISNPSTIDALPSNAQPWKLPTAEDINDIVLASIDTPPEAVANVDSGMATEAGLVSGDHSVNASVKLVDPTLASSSKIVLDEKINTNAESNPDVYSSSLDEEFALEWDDVDENTPVSDEVLKLLDQEIEDERKATENVQIKEIESGGKLINTLELQKDLENVIQSSEKVAETQNDADDVEMTPLNESFEQSRKIIDTDNFTEDKVQDVEMKDINELVEKNELMKSNDVKMNTEQSNKDGNDTMESKVDNIDTPTYDKDDKTLINPVLDKSIADNSIPVTHIEPSIESPKSASDGKTELESEALRDKDKIGLKHEELQVQENPGELIESSVTDNLHIKDEICDALFDSSIVDVEPTSSNPDDSELTVKTELTSENVKCTSSNPDDSVLTVKTELTSENLIENSGPTQQASNISEPLEIDHDNQTISPDFPLNVSLEQTEKEKIGIDKHLSQCLDGDSMLDTSINPNVHHQLNKPNAMLDIPTQELSDIEAEMDDDDSYNRSGQKSQESMQMEVSIEQMSSENVIKDNAEPATEITTATDFYEIGKPCSTERNQEINVSELKLSQITDNIQLSPTKSTEQNVISESESKYENVEKLQITDDVQLSTPKSIQETAVKLFKFESDVSPIRSTQDEPSTATPKKNILEEISLKIEFENDESSYKSPMCDLEPSTSTDEFGIETPLTSNINYGNDVKSTITVDEQPSTSKSTQITDDQPSSSKSIQDDTRPSALAVNKDINTESLLISKIKLEKDESTTKLVEHTGDKQPSTSQPNQISDDLPTSKSTHDNIQTSTLVVMEENDISTPTKTEEVSSISVEDDIQPTISNSTQGDIQPSTLKSTQEKIQTSTTIVMEENKISPTKPAEKLLPTSISTQDEIQPSTSKLTQDDKQSMSKSTQDDIRPSTSKSTQDDIRPSTSKSTQDDIKPCTSKSTDNVMQPSTSKSTQDDIQPSTSKFAHLQPLSVNLIDSEIPPTSQDSEKQSASKLNELTSDMAEVQEATDSLGLLAESSRVMDDDDEEPEDPEPENDDDDDFYTYEETSSQMVVEDDSVSPPPRMDPKESGTLGLGDMQTGPRLEFDEGTMDIDDFDLENELPDCESGDDDILEEIEYKEREPEIIDADAHKELPANKNSSCPPEKIMTILEKVLGHHNLPDTTVKAPLAMKIINYVDIEDGSSDSDDVLEVSKSDGTEVSVNIPKEVEVMATSAAGSTTEITTREGEVVISGIPKPAAPKLPTINTSEVTVSTAKYSTSIDIPETFIPPSIKDEIFDIESDEEEPPKDPPARVKDTTKEVVKKKKSVKTNRMCANPVCAGDPLSGDASTKYYPTDPRTATYFSLKKRGVVCHKCRELAQSRAQRLINGIKDLRPLLDLDMDAPLQQLVTISDSESDSDEGGAEDSEVIGGEAAKFLEEHLADMFNETWSKYKLASRLESAEANILAEMEKMEESVKEIDAIINDCQKTTDGTRSEFYGMFHIKRKHLGAILINDTPFSYFQVTDKEAEEGMQTLPARYPKRRATASLEPPAKKLAIPMGYAPIEPQEMKVGNESVWDPGTGDDDRDISVVKLSAEAAPSDLPPCGEAAPAPLRTGMATYAMRNAFGSWLKGKVVEIQPKVNGFTQCKVKFEHKVKNPCKVLAARCLAYLEPSEVRMTIGTRIIALFKDPQNAARREAFYSGVVAEIPNPVNNYRYLVFFDDGYAQYVHHRDTRLVCESSVRVWEEVHPFIRDFICKYLRSYPERPMVRLHTGERLKTEWNGKWWDSKVLRVDASIALIHFDEDDRTEWIYRGSTRLAPLYLELQAAQLAGERHRTRLPRSKAQIRSNMPYVEYTRSDSQIQIEELRRQKALLRRSTAFAASAVQDPESEKAYSRVVYYTPKNAVRPHKWVPHACSPACKRTDVLSLTELRSYNPLSKPLLSGWERQLCRFKLQREVMYRAPCGRRLRNMAELHRYLRTVDSDYGVELFEFNSVTHCLGEYVTTTCYVGKKDLSHGKENMPVPCVNNHDESLPEFCSYNTERTPTAGVPLNLDPDFLCGCDCTDDCEDKSKCACWKMTLEGARTIGLTSPKVGYVYRRLPEPLPSGIYECNSRCQCKKTCLNRVAQRPLQLKLQVFKTLKRGWGIRAVNDVPKGSFLCVYAGNLLTDATANLDGLNEGDEYLAELDYIEVVEAMKEGYEDDIPDADKKLDKKALGQHSESESNDEQTESSEDEVEQAGQLKDADFQPGYVAQTNVIFKKSLRKRELKNNVEETEPQKEEPKKTDDCITISDDEEVREPSRFTAQADMVDKSFKSKNSSRVSVRTLYGKDEACYIMDAKVQGNIGRYLNHSCCPNVFVQNVFVDTHDPRFPWVAFFALSDVKAGTELTWNYNYDVGSVPGKVLYCYCGEANCRGRLL